MSDWNAPLEPLDPETIHPAACIALWQAVLHQNRLDATASPLVATYHKERVERLRLILRARAYYGTPDFKFVCSLADVDETAETAFADSLKENGWRRTRAMTAARVP